ncbi:Tfp pilus assembly protein FimT/FimU [Caenimonas koreensis]|uniref:Type II secretion system protein GspH n=1 Tax=Caenimonas koreensis DSM 17982 TaxID=1121255 RepID=A0A844AWZ8_9BURK|nr:prepilin-type N-terminal cleavage/methylation domain-containing protein [Caenimonas koreensis]MRD48895.1 type II secretion system protein GspH [Caenimonas koreensis DSM 17982]
MRTSAAGNERRSSRGPGSARVGGFTLLELLIVISIIAIATAGVSFALRDSDSAQLEKEGRRLAALLESARAISRSSGVPVRWTPTETGFKFEGAPPDVLPDRWLDTTTQVRGTATLVLGPEPIIGKQEVTLGSATASTRTLRIATDGIRPFAVTNSE